MTAWCSRVAGRGNAIAVVATQILGVCQPLGPLIEGIKYWLQRNRIKDSRSIEFRRSTRDRGGQTCQTKSAMIHHAIVLMLNLQIDFVRSVEQKSSVKPSNLSVFSSLCPPCLRGEIPLRPRFSTKGLVAIQRPVFRISGIRGNWDQQESRTSESSSCRRSPLDRSSRAIWCRVWAERFARAAIARTG